MGAAIGALTDQGKLHLGPEACQGRDHSAKVRLPEEDPMATDYGGGRKKGVGPSGLVILVVGVVLAAAFIAGAWFMHRPKEIAKAQLWAISGPPCQAVSGAEAKAKADPISYRFENDDVTFGRAHGNVLCEDIVRDGGRGFGQFTECQFNAPGALQVTSGAGDFYYLVPAGAATVSMQTGRPVCVRGGWFRGQG
jgi:hypothetical protein